MSQPINFELKSDLFAYLLVAARSVLVGESTESPRVFRAFVVDTSKDELVVGVVANQTGANCACWVSPDHMCAFVGRDRAVAVVNLENAVVSNDAESDGAFFEFLVDSARGQLIAVNELGITVFSEHGALRWKYESSDILCDWKIDGTRILLTTIEGESVGVDLMSGLEVAQLGHK
jgi:hypothetical protein